MMQHLLNNTKSLSLGAYKHDTDCKYYALILLKILIFVYRLYCRLAPVLKTIFHQCVISYTCSQSNSDDSKTEPSELDLLQVCYDILMKNCFKDLSQSICIVQC